VWLERLFVPFLGVQSDYFFLDGLEL
jgi:hypothetical protein